MKIKNCPFCGLKPVEPVLEGEFWLMGCGRCSIMMERFSSKKELIKAWNTRADGWISVKDQMPGKEKFIMACNIRSIPDTLRIINPIFLTSAYTHWMPMPQILDAEEE